MLTQAQVQRYSNESGLRDIMIAEKEAVATQYSGAQTRDFLAVIAGSQKQFNIAQNAAGKFPLLHGQIFCALVGMCCVRGPHLNRRSAQANRIVRA